MACCALSTTRHVCPACRDLTCTDVVSADKHKADIPLNKTEIACNSCLELFLDTLFFYECCGCMQVPIVYVAISSTALSMSGKRCLKVKSGVSAPAVVSKLHAAPRNCTNWSVKAVHGVQDDCF